MTRQELRDLALSCGFKLKEQPDGSMDLNPRTCDHYETAVDALKSKLISYIVVTI